MCCLMGPIVFIVLLSTAAASDQLTVARCRANCISRLDVRPSNDKACSTEVDCSICWDHCRNLAEDWDKWSPVCSESQLDFCVRHAGCRHACNIMRGMSPPVNTRSRRLQFQKPLVEYREVSQKLQIGWRKPSQNKVVIGWIFFQEVGRPWQPLLQTLNSSIEVHVSGEPNDYAFSILLVDRDGVLIQSPVVTGLGHIAHGVSGPFSFTKGLQESGLSDGKPEDRWSSLLAGLQDINRRLGGNRTKLNLPPTRNALPIMLSVGLGSVAAIVMILVGVVCYFQRFQSKQMAEMRASFHAWSGRLGTSFRSSMHVARQSFRRRSARAYPTVHTIAESGRALKSDSAEWKDIP